MNLDTESQSRHIFSDLRLTVYPSHLIQFIQHQYINIGILMIHHLLGGFNPSHTEHRLTDIQNLVSLTQYSTENNAEYMAQVRDFDARLNKVMLNKVMHKCCLLRMSDNKYNGILNHYSDGNVAIACANFPQLESLMMGEDDRNQILRLTPTPDPIINSAQHALYFPKNTPASHPTGQDTRSPKPRIHQPKEYYGIPSEA